MVSLKRLDQASTTIVYEGSYLDKYSEIWLNMPNWKKMEYVTEFTFFKGNCRYVINKYLFENPVSYSINLIKYYKRRVYLKYCFESGKFCRHSKVKTHSVVDFFDALKVIEDAGVFENLNE